MASITNGVLYLDEYMRSCTPLNGRILYKELNGQEICIPDALLVRLYEIQKFEIEKQGSNWEEYCSNLFVRKET
jgi:hypothetical protein